MNDILVDLILLLGPSAAILVGFLIMLKMPEDKTIPSGSEYLIDENLQVKKSKETKGGIMKQ